MPEVQTTRYEYDSLGRQTATIGHPLPVEEVGITGYDLGTTVALRSETVYDSLGQVHQQRTNIRQVTLPDGSTEIDDSDVQVTTFEYDAHGNQTKTIFADQSFITAQYDEQGRKISETNQLGLTRTFEYDQAGRLTAVELPGVYNPATSQIESPRYEYGYDAQGNQTLLRDPLGRETWFTFDAQNRQATRTLPLGFGDDGVRGTGDDPVEWTSSSILPPDMPFTERMTYDALGRQHLHLSFEGVVTEHVFSDTTGRLIEKRFFDNLTQYDNGAGDPGEVWTYTHDAFGRVVNVERIQVTLPLPPGEGWGEGLNESTQYDPQGRVASVTTDQDTISYTYDLFGRLAATIIGTHAEPQRIISYTYDQLGRLKTVTEDQDPADSQSETLDIVYGYTLQGSLRRTHLPNGTIEKYVYDELNRLDLLTVYGPDETPEDLSDNPKIARFDYTVAADGRRTGLVEEFYEDGQSTPFVTNEINWEYDALGRLIEEDFDSSDNSLDYIESFLFDLAGNRLQKTRDLGRNQTIDETTTYSYDANDRLWTEAVDRLAADNSLTEYDWLFTQETDKTVYTGDTPDPQARVSSTEFTYDLQGRLHTATVTQYSGGDATRVETTTYDYNTSGIRVSALTETDANANGTVDSRVLTEFLNDANNHTGYSQVLRESHYALVDEASSLVRTIDYTFGHAEISQRTVETNDQGQVTNDQTLIFGHDGHGSVRVVTDLAAVAQQFYAFDAYGQMLAIWNATAHLISGGAGQYADPAAALINLLYSGEQFDTRINQQYLRARYYDATTGRFNRLDPLFGNHQDPLSFHKYLYVHADPVNGADPTGLAGSFSLTGMIGFMGVGAVIGAVAFPASGLGPWWQGALVGAGAGAFPMSACNERCHPSSSTITTISRGTFQQILRSKRSAHRLALITGYPNIKSR